LTIGRGYEGIHRRQRAGLASSVRPRRGGILKRRRTGIAWATGVLLLVAFVAVAAHHTEGRRFAELLRSARPAWLGAAAALQVATYMCAAAVWQRALRRNGGVRRSVRSLVPLGLAKLFADQALPSAGMSGTLLVRSAAGSHANAPPH
jgi:glycosyltransferase 2 family protein